MHDNFIKNILSKAVQYIIIWIFLCSSSVYCSSSLENEGKIEKNRLIMEKLVVRIEQLKETDKTVEDLKDAIKSGDTSKQNIAMVNFFAEHPNDPFVEEVETLGRPYCSRDECEQYWDRYKQTSERLKSAYAKRQFHDCSYMFIRDLMTANLKQEAPCMYLIKMIMLCQDSCKRLYEECGTLQKELTPAMVLEKQQLEYISKELVNILSISSDNLLRLAKSASFPLLKPDDDRSKAIAQVTGIPYRGNLLVPRLEFTDLIDMLEARMYMTHVGYRAQNPITEDSLSEFDIANNALNKIRQKLAHAKDSNELGSRE